MTNNDGITIDETSGISAEEQREILEQINSITEKNRRSLSHGESERQFAGTESPARKKETWRFSAKKKGGLFPVVVNIAAVVVVVAGLFLLLFFHRRTEREIRKNSSLYSTAERALIEEIRRETDLLILEKDNEIAEITLRLEAVDSQLRDLYSGNAELSLEQLESESELLLLQNRFRLDLAALNNEKVRIFEDYRSRETMLRSQFNAAMAQNSAELNSAREELARLSGEQERSAVVEAQLSGGLAHACELIRDSRFQEAGESLKSLLAFLYTPAFQGVRSIQIHKGFYEQTINLLEELVNSASTGQISFSARDQEAVTELRNRNDRLEESLADLNRELQSLSSGSSAQAGRVTELERAVASLNAANNSLEVNNRSLSQTVAARDRTISELQARNTALDAQVAARDRTISELQAKNAALDAQVAALNARIEEIRQAAQSLLNP
jgi:chromosome segregation ATPase